MRRGIKIGDYVLAELLNTGGMGQVWLAHQDFEVGGRSAAALKFPLAAGVLDPRVRDGLLDEARLQMQLQHDNIPTVFGMGVHEGLPYFVMKYIPGRSLAQLLSRLRDIGTPLRFDIIAHVAREVGYALRYAHGFEIDGVHHQVIHRDVAPKNVLVSGHGGVYVVDFGVAEALGIHSSRNHIKGTLLYMAPEHALGFPSPKSDGWGLGAILWEMIEGRQFRAEVNADDLRRAANQGLHGPLQRSGIPEVLRFVTEGLLRRNESERLTLDEALRLLESPEFPPQRTALAMELKQRFGASVHRSGQTLHDFEMPEHLDRTLAAAKVVKDAGPWEPDPWSTEAFAAAGAPAVVPAGGTRRTIVPTEVADVSQPRANESPAPVIERAAKEEPGPGSEPDRVPVHGTEPLPRVEAPSHGSEAVAVPTEPVPPPVGARGLTERVPRPMPGATPAFVQRLDPREPAPAEAREITAVWDVEAAITPNADPAPAPSASAREGTSSTICLDVEIDRDAPAALQDGASPSSESVAAPRAASEAPSRAAVRRIGTAQLQAFVAAALGLLVVGIAWAGWPTGANRAEHEATLDPPPVTTEVAAQQIVVDAAPAPVAEAPAAAGESSEPNPFETPTPAAPAPAVVPAPVEPPAAVALPDPVIQPPSPAPAAKPVRKKAVRPRPPSAPSPPVELTLALLFFADVDVEINGLHFSLSGKKATAKTSVPAGRVRTRWRRPLGEWKRKTFVVEPGVRYKVLIDDRGLEFRPLPQKTP